ncbi:hypothetical protein TcasGA2_TC034216 [Tribolium castaneum]|uniref:Condensin complex subunit 2 n=1 Tax=Tribolium castaneum TaxID=7070 RepID=A0A139WP13_TRICA|nr:PREDICTED: condensin complex subunit 2-like [Tribolium castaneum]KYB29684.1 hypothetical protein TcasGA2_TC034216 [Tribolium castaneum]|eukprot:XP_008199845.1 PREDICTED: condensin complex subunit 2-like [Tribolium castaneum]
MPSYDSQQNLSPAPGNAPPRDKKIDMKKLKTCIWRQLTGEQGTVQPTKFSTVFEQLPQLAPEMGEDLSPHLAVLSVLHLCTDENLGLEATDENGDFTITKDLN